MDPTPEQLARLEARLRDRMWRLCSGEIYKISTADGRGIIPFIPSPEQRKIFEALIGGSKQLMLPKCRRPGFSTALGIWSVDSLLFVGGLQISLIDQNQEDASRKLENIVLLAFDELPSWLRLRCKVYSRHGSQFSVAMAGKRRSTFYAGMNARGGSNDLLWVSEWGVIQFEDPKRSAKIRSGALPSARHGITVVETTWAGGKRGDVFELLEPVLLGESDDWDVLFSPWWKDARNVHATAKVDAVALKYFAGIQARADAAGIEFTAEQVRWWAAEKRRQGIFMNRENPTFMDEMWLSPVVGAIYAEAIEQARAEGRISAFPIDRNSLVHTSWDLGAPRQTVVWYFQIVGPWIRIIDCDRSLDLTMMQRVAHMKGKGYLYGNHFLPHDAQQTKTSGLTMATELASAWLKVDLEATVANDYHRANLKFVPRCHGVWPGINHVLQMFPALQFIAGPCEGGIEALSMYRTPDGSKDATALSRPEPVHDWSSHTADALRTFGEALLAGLVKFGQAPVVPEEGEWKYPRSARADRPARRRRANVEISFGG